MLNLTDKYNELTKPNLKELSETILLAAESLIEIVAEEGKQNASISECHRIWQHEVKKRII